LIVIRWPVKRHWRITKRFKFFQHISNIKNFGLTGCFDDFKKTFFW